MKHLSIYIAILGLWASNSFGAVFSCNDLLLQEKRMAYPDPTQPPESVIFAGINKREEQISLSLREFKKEAVELSLYLLGERTLEQMTENLFYSPAWKKISLSEPVDRMRQEDGDEILLALYFEIKQMLGLVRYGEKSTRLAQAKIEQMKELVFVTHQPVALQMKTLEALKMHPKLHALPAVWLVGIDSSDPLQKKIRERVDLALFSEGGDFSVKSLRAEHVYLAGGDLNHCLSQTMATLATKAAPSHLSLHLMEGLVFIDDLPTVLTKEHFEDADFRDEMRQEMSDILDVKWKDISSTETPFFWQHRGTGRTLSIDIVE